MSNKIDTWNALSQPAVRGCWNCTTKSTKKSSCSPSCNAMVHRYDSLTELSVHQIQQSTQSNWLKNWDWDKK